MPDELSPIVIEDQVLAEGFVQVPVVVVFDPDLTAGAKMMYGALLWYAWRFDGVPGQAVIAQQLGGGERTIRRHLADLEAAGYIATERRGLGHPNRYVIKTLQNRTLPERPFLAGHSGHNWPLSAAKNGPSSIMLESVLDSVSTRTESESAPATSSAQTGALGAQSDSDFAKAIRDTATALNCPKEAKQLLTLAQAEQWPVDLIRIAGRVVGEAIASGAEVRKPGAYLTTAIRVMLSDRRQAVEVGKKKTADRRQDALAYARQIFADPIIGGNMRQVESILRESYGQQVAAWVAEQLSDGG
jgi:hypothetical protein